MHAERPPTVAIQAGHAQREEPIGAWARCVLRVALWSTDQLDSPHCNRDALRKHIESR